MYENHDSLHPKKITSTEILYYILGCVVLSYIIQFYWRRWKLMKFIGNFDGPTPLPLIGNSYYFIGKNGQQILENLMHISSNYISPVITWMGKRPTVIVTKPEDIQVVLNNPQCFDKGCFSEFVLPVVGQGLFSASDIGIWKQHRKIIVSTFNQKTLNSFVDVFVEQYDVLVDKIAGFVGQGTVDMSPHITAAVADIVCETILGVKMYVQSGKHDVYNWVHTGMWCVYLRMYKFWLHPEFIWKRTKLCKEFTHITEQLRSMAKEITQKRKIEFRNKQNQFDDGDRFSRKSTVLDQLLEYSESGEDFPDEEIIDEVLTLIIGGSDSTSTAEGYILLLLGMFPEIQEQVYEELQHIYGDNDRPIAAEDLPHMKLLERVCKETMRIFPVGPIFTRKAYENIKLRKGIIPKGSEILVLTLQLHRDPELWENPLKFDPDRFLPENAQKIHPYAYLPFSGGSRSCIGMKFSMMSMKTGIASILRKFKVTTPYKSMHEIDVSAEIVLRPLMGSPVQFELRQK